MIFDLIVNLLHFWRLPNPTLSVSEVTDLLVDNSYSLLRWGDGEVSLINAKSIYYQDVSAGLTDMLSKALITPHPKVIVGLPALFVCQSVFSLVRKSKFRIWMRSRAFYIRHRKVFQSKSVNAFGFRRESGFLYVPVLRKLCDGIDTLIVVSSNPNAESVLRKKLYFKGEVRVIVAPQRNSYSCIESISKELRENNHGKTLALFACGPLSKILVDRMCKLSCQSIDIGHLVDQSFERET